MHSIPALTSTLFLPPILFFLVRFECIDDGFAAVEAKVEANAASFNSAFLAILASLYHLK
jgi:hypothetical protein